MSRSLRAPHLGCACFSRTISHTTASPSSLAWLSGRREHSAIPSKPLSKNRSRHLYPVLGLIPYSWHNWRKLLVCSAFNTNSFLWFIGSTFCHGIQQPIKVCPPGVTYVLNHLCYLCIETGPMRVEGWV